MKREPYFSPSPNARSKDKRGRTALILAALGGHVDVINALIEKGARLEDKDKNRAHGAELGRNERSGRSRSRSAAARS